MIPQVPAPLTHPATAWFTIAVPIFMTLAAVLIAALFGPRVLQPVYQRLMVKYTSRNHVQIADPALIFVPKIVSAQQYFGVCTAALVLVWGLVWLTMPMWGALLLSPLVLVLVLWLVLLVAEKRYVAQLERSLATTVARMAALLANGMGFQPVLRRIVEDLPEGPLRQEWQFIIDKLGTPLADGSLSTAQVVVNALRFQTPSQRHRALLEHLYVALGQTHDILAKRLQAAAQALHDSDRRRSAAATELAQMKYSGVAVGLAGLFMAAYLAFTQSERFLIVYNGSLGLLAGAVVLSALLAPLIGGVLLARSDDIDY